MYICMTYVYFQPRIPADISSLTLVANRYYTGTELSCVHIIIYYNNTIYIYIFVCECVYNTIGRRMYKFMYCIVLYYITHFYGLVLKPVCHTGCAIIYSAANKYTIYSYLYVNAYYLVLIALCRV